MDRRITLPAPLLVLAAALLLPDSTAAAQDALARASVSSSGAQGNRDSGDASPPAVSADLRFVAFESDASNLVAADGNHVSDVFVHDRTSGATVRVSVDSAGSEGDRSSEQPSISSDGRFVAFVSFATNLVAGDSNGVGDVFVRDRDPDGNGIYDEANATTTRVSVKTGGLQSNGNSFGPSISADGMLIAFFSFATNLVASDTNGDWDVFVYDQSGATTTRVSVTSSGGEANGNSEWPALSSDGSTVAFASFASNLVAGDGNGLFDVFVHELASGTTERVSVNSGGSEGDAASYLPSISSDGSVVAFESDADNLVSGDTNAYTDVFVRDRAAGTTTRASVDSAGNQGDFGSHGAALSGDGKAVAFWSFADDLVPGDANFASDVFLRDLAAGTTDLISDDCTGLIGDDDSLDPALSADASVVAFGSFATGLVTGDSNGACDVFVHDRAADVHASWSNYGAGFPGTLGVPSLTASANPVFGASFTIDVGNSLGATTSALLLIGLQRASIPTSAGGTLLVDLLLSMPLSLPAGGLSLPAGFPHDPALCGVTVDLQAIELDPGAAKKLSFTAGLELAPGI
jgi:Tol biopolymer transport system component